jgi:hypothetical protein
MRVLLSLLLAIAVLMALGGLTELVRPPYTDAELLNLVDDWEPYAIGTFFCLSLEWLLSLFAGILAWLGHGLSRRLAIATALIALLAGGVKLGRHIILTKRTTRLTDPTYDGFYELL